MPPDALLNYKASTSRAPGRLRCSKLSGIEGCVRRQAPGRDTCPHRRCAVGHWRPSHPGLIHLQKLKKLIKAHQQHKEEADGRLAPSAAATAASAGAAGRDGSPESASARLPQAECCRCRRCSALPLHATSSRQAKHPWQPLLTAPRRRLCPADVTAGSSEEEEAARSASPGSAPAATAASQGAAAGDGAAAGPPAAGAAAAAPDTVRDSAAFSLPQAAACKVGRCQGAGGRGSGPVHRMAGCARCCRHAFLRRRAPRLRNLCSLPSLVAGRAALP